MKKTLVLIHNGPVLIEKLDNICSRFLPNITTINIMDSSMVRDIIEFKDMKLGSKLMRRVVRYSFCAEDLGADAIIMTCSSLCGIVDIAKNLVDIPMFKIIQPMTMDAVKKGSIIGLMATLPSAIEPTYKQLTYNAEILNKHVEVNKVICGDAFSALISGNREKHDKLIEEEAIKLAQYCDVLVLAQGSMADMANRLSEIIQKPVLSCLESGIKQVQEILC